MSKNPRIGHVLGRGQFGEVSTGTYKNKPICIKTCRPQNYSDDEIRRFGFKAILLACRIKDHVMSLENQKSASEQLFEDIFKEALQMKYFEHENVMKLLGVSLDEYCNPEIILPLMDKGDLLTYIKKPQNDITYKQVLSS